MNRFWHPVQQVFDVLIPPHDTNTDGYTSSSSAEESEVEMSDAEGEALASDDMDILIDLLGQQINP